MALQASSKNVLSHFSARSKVKWKKLKMGRRLKFWHVLTSEMSKSIVKGIGIGFLSCIGIGIGIAKTISQVLVLVLVLLRRQPKYWYWYWYC